jgi:hypothetical protein
MLTTDPRADDLARMVGEGHAPVLAVLLAVVKEKADERISAPKEA